jgi:RimJ/RimL family protein N-acetyltransferase
MNTNPVFSLRDVNENDHPWLVNLHNDPVVLHNLTNPEPISLEGHLRWWSSLNRQRERRQIFCVGGAPAGFVKIYAIDRINRNCVLGADLQAEFRGRGFAKPMWALLLDVCFKELALHRVSLTTAAYNEIGQKVYRGLGFREEGRLAESLYRDGKFHDQLCFYMVAADWNKA